MKLLDVCLTTSMSIISSVNEITTLEGPSYPILGSGMQWDELVHFAIMPHYWKVINLGGPCIAAINLHDCINNLFILNTITYTFT